VLGNVLIRWEDILFYRHTRAATFIRATLHRYSMFEDVCRAGGVYANGLSGRRIFRLPSSAPLQ
jgi:aromatic ring hydroxylase